MSSFRIRIAVERQDWRALRMLLPEAVHHACGCDVLVATDDDASRRIIGAVAVAPLMRRIPLQGPKTAFHVIEPWRGRGVARALRNAAINLAAARGAHALYAADSVGPESGEAAAWRALGFTQILNCPLNRIDAQRTVDLLRPVSDRLQRRGQFPTDARIVPIEEAAADEIVGLVTNYLGGVEDEATLRKRLCGKHPTPIDPILSRILLRRKRVVGALLARPVAKDAVWVEANVVHPSMRGRWANVWLKLDAASRALDHGFKTFLYETRQPHADTAKLTSRLAGVLVPRVELYHIIASTCR